MKVCFRLFNSTNVSMAFVYNFLSFEVALIEIIRQLCSERVSIDLKNLWKSILNNSWEKTAIWYWKKSKVISLNLQIAANFDIRCKPRDNFPFIRSHILSPAVQLRQSLQNLSKSCIHQPLIYDPKLYSDPRMILSGVCFPVPSTSRHQASATFK